MPVGEPLRQRAPGMSTQVHCLGGATSLSPSKGPAMGQVEASPPAPPAPALVLAPPAPTVTPTPTPTLTLAPEAAEEASAPVR